MFAELGKGSARSCALTVAVVYAVIGAAWVLVTDILLYRLVSDTTLMARIETAKGWSFVSLTAILLYVVTLRSTGSLGRAKSIMSSVLDSIGDGVLLLGSDRSIRCANPAAESMLNADKLAGMAPREFARVFQVSRTDGTSCPVTVPGSNARTRPSKGGRTAVLPAGATARSRRSHRLTGCRDACRRRRSTNYLMN